MSNVRLLDVGSNNFDGVLPKWIADDLNLKTLRLSNNRFRYTEEGDDSMKDVATPEEQQRLATQQRARAEKQWLDDLVDALKTFGGKSDMTILGSDVKKPKGVPKKLKLAYFMGQHKDVFDIAEGIRKRDRKVLVTLRQQPALGAVAAGDGQQ